MKATDDENSKENKRPRIKSKTTKDSEKMQEKPREKSKRIDVYYPPSKERLGSINVNICDRHKLEFDPSQFNFKPTTNTSFEGKSECDNETSSDSVDEKYHLQEFLQYEIYMTEIPKHLKKLKFL
ncbi:hypothetical protein AVEN_227077-1 [Araneus ventricosus]|uniref:Uncharacterized protein n=1 Tax=Araneus ventricosus TaxID=182803 RepID=A0A4Y2VZ63_ARAVE|nr:hypothetical protein AVEN_227077-1 [Araneus ventricosus]